MKDFLFTLLAWLLTLPCIVVAVGFAIYNPQTIQVTLNPFRPPIDLALYVPVLAAIAIGFLFGALMTWAGMAGLRKDRRDQRKKIKALEKQIETASRATPPPPSLPQIQSGFTEQKQP